MVTQAVHIVLTIFLMIGLGMFLARIGWLRDEHAQLLIRLVSRVALPGAIMSNLLVQFTRESLIQSAPGLLLVLLTLLALLALSALVGRLIRVPDGRAGAFRCMFAFSNSVFIGVPVSVALFGEAAVPYAMLYYIVNTTLFWSVGYAAMAADGGARKRLDWKNLLSVPLIAFFVCAALVMAGVSLPKFVMDAAGYVGDLVTPLSMLYIGLLIMRMVEGGRLLRWHRGYAWMLIGRFVLSPLLLVAFSMLIPIPAAMRNVLLVQAAMPVMTQISIVAAECGSDAEYAAGGTALSTLLSLLAIPAYMALIPFLPG